MLVVSDALFSIDHHSPLGTDQAGVPGKWVGSLLPQPKTQEPRQKGAASRDPLSQVNQSTPKSFGYSNGT